MSIYKNGELFKYFFYSLFYQGMLIQNQDSFFIKYMQAQHSSITKTFQLFNQLTNKTSTYSIQVPYIPITRQINISKALSNICDAGLNLNNCHIFYLDVLRKLYVHIGCFPFKQEVQLKYELFIDNAIKIRYRNINQQQPPKTTPQTSQISQSGQGWQKKKKIKERTIREVREYVSHWRHLYQQVDNKGKRIHTLQTAACQVGLAKKTLDDYFYQIKQGQHFGFKFQEHYHQKIGVLRKFVKIHTMQNLKPNEVVAPQDDIDRYLASDSSDEDKRYK